MTLAHASLALSFVALLASGCTAAVAPPHRGTLESLRTAMQEVRAGGDGVVETLPSLEALIGAPRQEVVRALGAPRVCRTPVEEPCTAPGEILWTFYRAHHETIGPVLVVDLDAAQIVTGARWRHGEVEASAPMEATAPSSGGESELASE